MFSIHQAMTLVTLLFAMAVIGTILLPGKLLLSEVATISLAALAIMMIVSRDQSGATVMIIGLMFWQWLNNRPEKKDTHLRS